MIGHQPTEAHSTWGDIGKGAAAEMKRSSRNVSYIEARGQMPHELMYLLGGCIEFIETPMREYVLKALEFFLPIAPICRWIPPPNSALEQIGYQGAQQTRVYRFKPEVGETVVFFVNYKPEPPIGGSYLRSLFNVPQLDLYYFLRPPFRREDRNELYHVLRRGIVETFPPIPMTEDARESLAMKNVEMCRAMWEEFCRS